MVTLANKSLKWVTYCYTGLHMVTVDYIIIMVTIAYTSFTRARLLGLARIRSDRFEKVPSSHELQKRDLAWKIKAPNIKYLL